LKVAQTLLSSADSFSELFVRGDSELLVKQINGVYRCKAENLIPTYLNCRSIIKELKSSGIKVKVEHVKRKFNSRADELANKAMDAEETSPN